MRAATKGDDTNGRRRNGPGGGREHPTVWSIQANVLDPNSGTMTSTSMGTVTFTESAPGQGSYETSAANVFMLDGLFGPATGTQTGKYFLVGDWLLMTGQVSGNNSGYTWLARIRTPPVRP